MLLDPLPIRLVSSSDFASSVFVFLKATAPPEVYTLSLHDALPIYRRNFAGELFASNPNHGVVQPLIRVACEEDRKSTRLNSSHANSSYAVFCLKKKRGTYWQPLPACPPPQWRS